MPTGLKIKEIRTKKGLTQKQLSEKCNMYESQIRKYENGQANPKMETLQKIATALECNISDLLDDLTKTELKIKAINQMVLDVEEYNLAKARDASIHRAQAIAAHFYGDEYTEEELDKIKEYAAFIKSQRKN